MIIQMKKAVISVSLLYICILPAIALAAVAPPPGEEGPIIINELPSGTVTIPRPTISAKIFSPVDNDIDLDSIELQLDGLTVSHSVAPSTGGPNVEIFFTPDFDLSLGVHTVEVNAMDVNGLVSPGLIWTFEIIYPKIVVQRGILGDSAEINGVTVVIDSEIRVICFGAGWKEVKLGVDDPDLTSAEWQPYAHFYEIQTNFTVEDAGQHYIYAKLRMPDGQGGWIETEEEIKDEWIYNSWYVKSASGVWKEDTSNNQIGWYSGTVDTVLEWMLPAYAYEISPGVWHSILYDEDSGLRYKSFLWRASDFDCYTNLHYTSNFFMHVQASPETLPYIGAPVTVFLDFGLETLAEFKDYYLWGGGEASRDRTKEVPCDKITTVAEPINVANGNMFTSQTDILVPGLGIPLELSRTYNSQDDFEGCFGYGWRCNYDVSLAEQSDGSVIEIDEKGVHTVYTKNPDGSYAASPGKYSELTKNPDGSFIILRKHGRKLFFNAGGRLIRIEERNNNFLDILYGAGGVINEVSDSRGRKLIFTSDSEGKITQVKDPADRIFRYEYDSDGNLIKTIDPLDGETLYLYDDNHNIIRVIDANEHSLYFEYDSSDRAYHSWQDSVNNEVTLSFVPSNNITTSTDSLGNTTLYEYNDFGLVTRITNPYGNVRSFTWDEDFNKTSFIDENSNAAYFTYDSKGNIITTIDPQGNTTTFTYEPNFYFVSSATDALANTSTCGYDDRGNLIEAKDALGNTAAYAYDSRGDLISLADARGNNTNYEYDECGNLIKIIDPLGGATLFSYDLLGNRTGTTDAKGNTANFIYDELNRLIKIIYPDGSGIAYTYDAVGNRTSITDPGGKVTFYTYDEIDRLIQIKDALEGITSYAYDTEGNTTAVIDANGNATSYHYDEMKRLIKTLSPSGKETSFTYDAAGNRTTVTDAKGNTISYNYDTLNRLINKVYPDSSAVEFTYDKIGRVISMADNQGITSYGYDGLGRLLEVDGPLNNDVISYEYDSAGNRISMTNQDGEKTLYAYDALNRLAQLMDPAGKATLYAYDEVSNLVEMNCPNGIESLYTFDNLNRLINLVNQEAKGKYRKDILSSYGYDYDLAGMRTKAVFSDGSYIEYAYDGLNRLTEETKYGRGGRAKHKYEYIFDPVGNRLTMKRYPFIVTDYAYNEENQLISEEKGIEKKGKFISLQKTQYTYDNNGNQVEKRTAGIYGCPHKKENITTYEYDYENRLTKIMCPDVIQYEYDGAGKRIKAVDGEGVTTYHYDGLNACIERDADGETVASYVRGLSYGGGIGGIISARMIAPGHRYSNLPSYDIYYHYDGIGNVSGLSDSRGRETASYAYDAYGNILRETGIARNNPYRFSTKEHDSPSNLCYFGARYYDPRIGRWLTKDPLGMIDGVNLYVYCNNNPVNWIDPWGLCGEKEQRESFIEQLRDAIKDFDPNYGNWGGNNWSGGRYINAEEIGDIKVLALDSLDALYKQHDIDSYSGNVEANRILAVEVRRLPPDPNKWKNPPKNPFWAKIHRKLAEAWFR